MGGYQKGFDLEDMVIDGVVGLVIIGVIIAAAIAVTIIFVTLRELVTIYERRARSTTTGAKVLWGSLAILLLLWYVVGLVAQNAALAPYALYCASFGTLVWVCVCEYVDVHEGHNDSEQARAVDELDSYVDFTPATDGLSEHSGLGAPSANGYTPRESEPVGTI